MSMTYYFCDVRMTLTHINGINLVSSLLSFSQLFECLCHARFSPKLPLIIPVCSCICDILPIIPRRGLVGTSETKSLAGTSDRRFTIASKALAVCP